MQNTKRETKSISDLYGLKCRLNVTVAIDVSLEEFSTTDHTDLQHFQVCFSGDENTKWWWSYFEIFTAGFKFLRGSGQLISIVLVRTIMYNSSTI